MSRDHRQHHGWIKLWKDMMSDPRLMAAAQKLTAKYEVSRRTPGGSEPLSASESIGFLCNAVTGALVTLWCHADEHIRDDDTLEISSNSLDAVVRLEGFFAALPRQWINELDNGRVVLPGYCEKNSLITKRKRASKSNARVRRWRTAHQPQERCVTTGVTRGVTSGVTSGHVTQCNGVVDKDQDRDILKEGEALESSDAPQHQHKHGKAKAKALTSLPEDFALSELMREHATLRAPGCDAEVWFGDFCAYYRANGKRMRDWPAAWRGWVSHGVRFGYPRQPEALGASRGLPSLNG